MLSKQHLVVALNAIADAHPDYSVKQIEEEFQRMAPYVVAPDTIRVYGIPREMTHYEDGDVNKDTFKIDHSSFSYPADLKSPAKDFSAPVAKAEGNAYEHAIKQTALEFNPLSAPAGMDR